MGIALGGIGVISLRAPFTMSNSFLHLLDLPSILLATFIVAVFGLIGQSFQPVSLYLFSSSIAYFTNPNEASFRAFLTELAFRQHLSRLSETQEGDTDEYDDDSRSHNGTRLLDYKNTRKHGTPQGSGLNHGHASASITETPIVFHFANKASVSLRTPGYHFRSFAVLTFAIALPVEMAIAPVPVPNPAHHTQPPKPISWNNPSTHGTWFVGAFGRWWFGLEMNMPPRQVRLTAQDDAALRERELVRSRGDDVESSSGSRHAEEVFSSHKASRLGIPRRTSSAAPPRTKAALRERLSLQTSSSNKRDANTQPPRPTTPPPLPKSASLPLHAKRVPPPKTENNAHNLPLLSTPTVGEIIGPAFARTPSTHDQSPIITDILKQLDATRSATSELHTQLSEFQDVSARAHAILQTEVDAARAMKKREDSGRAEIKTKTKILDDARRQADGSKREAEKKLKAATVARDGATGRIERLGREVEELRRRMADDSARVTESRREAEAERHEISETLTLKREEIKVAEEVVVALTTRARDLEAEVAEETARLKKLKEEAEGRRQRHSAVSKTDKSSWPPPLLIPQRSPSTQFASHQVASTLGTDTVRPSADFSRPPLPPHPHPLNVGGISNHPLGTAQTNGDSGVTPPDGQYVPQFRPFADPPVVPLSTPAYSGSVSPVSAPLVPSSLAQSRESPRSSLPNNDILFSRLPIVRPPPSEELSPIDDPQQLSHTDQFDSQRAVLPPRPRSPSFDDEPMISKPSSRRWFSAAAKEKGLNPDAKEFTLPYGRPLALGIRSGASTPNTFGSEIFPPQRKATESPPPRVGLAGSFFSSLHNPFAPSPAEREALQRALGSGSGNASLERVSSHGSGSGNGGGGGASNNSSLHWLSEPRRDVTTSTRRSFFNPWATEGK